MGDHNLVHRVESRLALLLFVFFIFSPLASAVSFPYTRETILPKEQAFNPTDAFQPDLFTGAATYQYEFKLPPGTNDLEPSLFLSYNSHLRNTRPGVVGAGWRLNENYIQRNTNFTYDNGTDDSFLLVFNGASYNLVNSSNDNRFHTSLESFMNIQYFDNSPENTNGTYWLLHEKDGTTYRFGYYNYSEHNATESDLVWRWSIDLVTDTHDNKIFYAYSETPYPNEQGTVYLDNITYNNDQQRVIEFVYEPTDRRDVWEVYEEGTRLKELRRLKGINVTVNGILVRSYLLDYNYLLDDDYQGQSPIYSYLMNITELGSDSASTLPPTHFSYSRLLNTWTGSNGWTGYQPYWRIPGCIDDLTDPGTNGCFTTDTGKDNGVRAVDIDRDGLPDLIRAKERSGTSNVWTNRGWTAETTGIGTAWRYDGNIFYPECAGSNDDMCFTDPNDDDNGVRLDDINGDGFVDLVRANTVGNVKSKIYLGNGYGWDLSSITVPNCNGSTGDLCFTETGKDYGVQLLDINGDGLADIVKARQWSGQTTNSQVWLNTGNGWNISNTFIYPECNSSSSDLCFVTTRNSIDGEDNGVRLGDVNGDGLVDIVKARTVGTSGQSSVWLNTGSGWKQNTAFVFPRCTGSGTEGDFCFINNDGTDRGVRLLDVNGDRLVDIVVAYFGFSEVRLNSARGWGSTGPTNSFPKCPSTDNYGCFVDPSTGGADRGVRLIDVNGDGTADSVVGRPGEVQPETYLNKKSQYGILKEIISPLGGITSITYLASTLYNHTKIKAGELGFSLLLIDSLTKDNQMGNDQTSNGTTYYTYAYGRYDYKDKDFRGFANVTELLSNVTNISHYYHQDDGLQGKEFQTEIHDASFEHVYQRRGFTWNTTLQDGYYITFLSDENTSSYDGVTSDPKISSINYVYDSYGNIVSKISNGDESASGDERYDYLNFVYNTNAWIVGAVSRSVLYADAQNASKIRETQYSYDGQTYGSAPSRGDITQEEKVNDGGSNAVTQYTYDTHGNVVNITDSNNHVSTFVFGLRDTTFTLSDQEINAKGHATNKFYDLGTGNVLSLIDPNGFNTTYTYDVFGRVTAEIKPLDTIVYQTKNYTYDFDGIAPEKTKVSVREQNETDNTFDTYTFIDGLGNTIQTKVEAENGQQIVEDIYYDNLSRISMKSNKYFADFFENYTAPNLTVPATNYSYDALNRIINTTNPDQTLKQFIYDHWTETHIDENDNNKTFVKDAYGNTITVIENNAGAITTTYAYNAANELLNITDDQGNAFLFFYDSLGRKTSQVDPDLGIWNYTYDGVGNLITTKDNRGITTTNTYDELDRITKKTNTDGTYDYFYDEQLLGTLSSVGSADFARNYTYDSRLRLASDTKTIDGLQDSFIFGYDSLDRPISIIWNDIDNFTLTYSDQGIASGIEGILDSTTHNELNAVLARLYNNSEVTNFTYNESNFRLQRIQTDTKQDIFYDFDNISNILAINDTANDRAYAMTYDALSRLLSATRWDAAQVIFDFVHIYDNLGRILNVTSTAENLTYYYNGTPAHAPYKIDYEFAGQGLQLESLGDLSGSGFTRVFEFIVNNTENMTLTDLNWTLQTGIDNITSELAFNLSTYEDIFVYVEYNYSTDGNYTVTAIAENMQYYTSQSLQIVVP